MTLKIKTALAALSAGVALAACDPIDTSALREIEETAEAARTTAEGLNARASEIQGAIDDPVGALRTAALGATFTKTPTAEPNLFILTDLQTGCQWLATYGPGGEALSLVARTEQAGQATVQRCIPIGGRDLRASEGAQ
ncbi:MAG: hypothetical protein B7Z01_00680 [Brevundimonas subvibrioides]|jgi:hypothetical protein|uniref:Lipoprotein n=1 Tax=Brevundimonas subvibrioides TaxID=74313 RepID=A0A258FW56_9CAUL|nr:MAG: hypothetical protein B7Z01_00680 [Brevundimonas subvibrioides]HVL40730.1 hypothetical protein [Brevundimonas sp.]